MGLYTADLTCFLCGSGWTRVWPGHSPPSSSLDGRAPREPASVTLGRAPGAKGAHMAGTSVSTNSKILIQLKTPTPLPSPTRHLLLSLIPLNLQTGRRAGQDQLPTADSVEQALWSHHYRPITSKGNLKKRPNSIFLLLYSSL